MLAVTTASLLACGLVGVGSVGLNSVAAAAPAGVGSGYNIVDLGGFGGSASGVRGQGVAINDSGQVAGSVARADGAQRAFVWTAGGGMVDLGVYQGWENVPLSVAAADINNAGEVVGSVSSSFPQPQPPHAFTWTAAGGMNPLGAKTFGDTLNVVAINDPGQIIGNETTPGGVTHAMALVPGHAWADLGVLGGSGRSYAVAVNQSGQVAGTSSTATSLDAFSWTAAGGMVDLGHLGGGFSQATAISDNGQVVGSSYTGVFNDSHAFSWTAAHGMVDLGTLGGASSGAFAVNSHGQIIGWSTHADGSAASFSWTAAAGMVDLGNLGGAGGSQAEAVNDYGQVVGRSQTANGGWDAFSWTAAGGIVDLGALPGDWSTPRAVNNLGQIVGVSYPGNIGGPDEATLWQPTTLQGPPADGGGLPAGGGPVAAGGTVSSDPAGTAPNLSNPLVVTLTSPVAGSVKITKGITSATLSGYTALGFGVQIAAPLATAARPLRLEFAFYVGGLPSGSYPGDVTVFRDGAAVPACPDAVVANPDPCVTSTSLSGGVQTDTVLSSHASSWDLQAAQVGRLAGSDRSGTAIAVSQAEFPIGGAASVVLARGDGYADALVGAPLAAARNAPLLLTAGTVVTATVQTEIRRVLLPGGTVYILGGISAVPDGVAVQLSNLGYHVVRYGGADRYATAVQVADALGDPATVLLATGTDFPDALSAGVAAAKAGGVVLLTNGNSLPTPTSSYLSAHGSTVYAIGGPAAAADANATALVGADRYATSVDVAQKFFPGPQTIGIATGAAFPDALSGGVLFAHLGAPLVLAAPTALPASTASYLTSVKGTVSTAQLFGGFNALGAGVQTAIGSALGR